MFKELKETMFKEVKYNDNISTIDNINKETYLKEQMEFWS